MKKLNINEIVELAIAWLETGERWKDFIHDEMNDRENASLVCINLFIHSNYKNSYEADMQISYNILENSATSDTTVKITVNKNNTIRGIQ